MGAAEVHLVSHHAHHHLRRPGGGPDLVHPAAPRRGRPRPPTHQHHLPVPHRHRVRRLEQQLLPGHGREQGHPHLVHLRHHHPPAPLHAGDGDLVVLADSREICRRPDGDLHRQRAHPGPAAGVRVPPLDGLDLGRGLGAAPVVVLQCWEQRNKQDAPPDLLVHNQPQDLYRRSPQQVHPEGELPPVPLPVGGPGARHAGHHRAGQRGGRGPADQGQRHGGKQQGDHQHSHDHRAHRGLRGEGQRAVLHLKSGASQQGVNPRPGQALCPLNHRPEQRRRQQHREHQRPQEPVLEQQVVPVRPRPDLQEDRGAAEHGEHQVPDEGPVEQGVDDGPEDRGPL
mmetsp:Transcript_49374/g.112038  ORF Transcript_49374/g.112038 Transcript_49374/m.112038 type:complete len:340 (+) Transcript_49374:1813-2832(+)